MSMKQLSPTIAIFGNCHQVEKSKYVERVIRCLYEQGACVCVESYFMDFLRVHLPDCSLILSQLNTFDADQCEADLAISMGGDGTFLNTAEKIGLKNIPIIGVNTGRLGFLADVTPDEIENAMTRLVRGDYLVKHRSLLEARVEGKKLETSPYALNEIAVLKRDNSSLIEVSTWVNGEKLTNYIADGLIISTPTGSTGYSLSVGGPILDPESATIALAPVAPHSLTMRPIVLPDSDKIELKVHSRTRRYLIAIDGRNQSMPIDTKIYIQKAQHTIPVIKMYNQDFFDMLRKKMRWGEDSRV